MADWPFEPTEDDRTDAQVSVYGKSGPYVPPMWSPNFRSAA